MKKIARTLPGIEPRQAPATPANHSGPRLPCCPHGPRYRLLPGVRPSDFSPKRCVSVANVRAGVFDPGSTPIGKRVDRAGRPAYIWSVAEMTLHRRIGRRITIPNPLRVRARPIRPFPAEDQAHAAPSCYL